MAIEDAAREKLPVVEEAVAVERVRRVTGIVRAKTETHEDTIVVDEPLLAEQVIIERVPMDRWVDHPVAVREEGDTTIIPVVEEVVILEKRLKRVEEVRVTKQKTTSNKPQTITVRRQKVVVERLPGSDDADMD
jgi:stress response protein YsnF